MPVALALYDVVLSVHVAAVVVAFGAVFTFPLWFKLAEGAEPAQRAILHRLQATIDGKVVSYGLLVVILAGAYMASDRDLWAEPWVGGPLLIAIVVGGLAGGVLAPRERRLAELAQAGADGAAEYERQVALVKRVGALAGLLVLVAIFLMVTKVG